MLVSKFRGGGVFVLRGIQTFKIVVDGSKHAGNQSDDSGRSRANGIGPAAEATLDGDGESTIDFGQSRLRPTLFFEFGLSTSANFDFGQCRLRPIFGC